MWSYNLSLEPLSTNNSWIMTWMHHPIQLHISPDNCIVNFKLDMWRHTYFYPTLDLILKSLASGLLKSTYLGKVSPNIILFTAGRHSKRNRQKYRKMYLLLPHDRAASLDFRQPRQPRPPRCCCWAPDATAMFYFAKYRQDSCLGCLTPRGGSTWGLVTKYETVYKLPR